MRMVTSQFGQFEIHPLHGLSNRLLAIVSTLLLGVELQIRISIDWRLDDSRYINAPFKQLIDVHRLPRDVDLKRQPPRHAKHYKPNRCDAYYRQQLPGWHSELDGPGAYDARLRGYTIRGGGFAGSAPGHALDAFMQGSLPRCNDSALFKAVVGLRRRPHVPDVSREGCSAYFRGFETLESCSWRSKSAKRALRAGLSLWSPVRPLNGTCVFPLLPPESQVLRTVKWLPRRTLGVHVRRGDLASHWPRASSEEFFAAAEQLLHKYDLRHIFVASDDHRVRAEFEAHFSGRRRYVLLPSVLNSGYMPQGHTKVDRARLWSKEGNVASLSEQLTLATADVILGSWGSTYSTLAAAWFDRPITYVPAQAAADCLNATVDRPCRWRGAATYPSAKHVHGSKCGQPLNDLVDTLRRQFRGGTADSLDSMALDYAIDAGRRTQGFRVAEAHNNSKFAARSQARFNNVKRNGARKRRAAEVTTT